MPTLKDIQALRLTRDSLISKLRIAKSELARYQRGLEHLKQHPQLYQKAFPFFSEKTEKLRAEIETYELVLENQDYRKRIR